MEAASQWLSQTEVVVLDWQIDLSSAQGGN